MKAGLTVLVAIASASVNAHVKVETVNFDEDLLNTEKNIAGTFAWKEKAFDRPDEFVNFKFDTNDIKFKTASYIPGEKVDYYSCTGDLTIGTLEYSDVTLQFKHVDDGSQIYNGLWVQIQDDTMSWMDDYATYEKNGGVSKHTFQDMEENYQKLYKISEGKTEEMKGTEKEMKWTIPRGRTEMVNNTRQVEKGLEPQKKPAKATTQVQDS